jgi:hypothetical protein
VITAGSLGKAEATTVYGLLWANLLVVDDNAVDPLNVPLFPSAADAIRGSNTRPGADVSDAQVSAFCTFCHQNYGYASEAVVNPDNDRSLFQGQWYAKFPEVDGTTADADGDGWASMNNAEAQGAPFKNHPLKSAGLLPFAAAGKGASVPADVAFVASDTCRSCHDAGTDGRNDVDGVIVQSWPHFTPGYFHFVKSASHAGAAMTNAPPIPDVLAATNTAGIAAVHAWLDDPINYEESTTVQDGQCLKCHIDSAGNAGVGKTY